MKPTHTKGFMYNLNPCLWKLTLLFFFWVFQMTIYSMRLSSSWWLIKGHILYSHWQWNFLRWQNRTIGKCHPHTSTICVYLVFIYLLNVCRYVAYIYIHIYVYMYTHIYVCMRVYMCTTSIPCAHKAWRGIGCPGTRVTDGCEPPCRCSTRAARALNH